MKRTTLLIEDKYADKFEESCKRVELKIVGKEKYENDNGLKYHNYEVEYEYSHNLFYLGKIYQMNLS